MDLDKTLMYQDVTAHDCSQHTKALAAQLIAVQRNIEALTLHHAGIEARLEKVRQGLADSSMCTNSQQRLQGLLDNTITALAECAEEKNKVNNSLTSIRESFQQQTQSNKELEDNLRVVTAENEKIKIELSKLTSECNPLKQLNKEQYILINKLTDEVFTKDELEEKVKEQISTIVQLNGELEAAKDQIDALNALKKDTTNTKYVLANTQLKTEVKTYKDLYDTLFADNNTQKENFKKRKQQFVERINSLNAEKKVLTASFLEIQEKQSDMQKKNDVLQKQILQFETIKDGITTACEERSRDMIDRLNAKNASLKRKNVEDLERLQQERIKYETYYEEKLSSFVLKHDAASLDLQQAKNVLRKRSIIIQIYRKGFIDLFNALNLNGTQKHFYELELESTVDIGDDPDDTKDDDLDEIFKSKRFFDQFISESVEKIQRYNIFWDMSLPLLHAFHEFVQEQEQDKDSDVLIEIGKQFTQKTVNAYNFLYKTQAAVLFKIDDKMSLNDFKQKLTIMKAENDNMKAIMSLMQKEGHEMSPEQILKIISFYFEFEKHIIVNINSKSGFSASASEIIKTLLEKLQNIRVFENRYPNFKKNITDAYTYILRTSKTHSAPSALGGLMKRYLK